MIKITENLIDLARKAEKRLKFKFPYSVEEWVNSKNLLMENYHKHTTWSDLVQIDSSTSIEDFIKLSDEYGCKCYFSGEHGYPGEWLHVYNVCNDTKKDDVRAKFGINNPITFRYSVEAYWVKDADAVFQEEYEDKKTGEKKVREKKDNANCHMVIVARTYNAMRKLNYILSCAHDTGFYYKPRIDLKSLFTLSKDEVYITSACIAGWKYEDATEVWLKIWQHFGDSFFLEYQTHNTPEQKALNKKIYEISKTFGIQTIIGLDTHYINEEDRIKRENLLLRKGLHYEDEEGFTAVWMEPFAASTAAGISTNGTQSTTSQSASATSGFISLIKAVVCAGVLFIFQLPAIMAFLFALFITVYLFCKN